MKTHNQNFQILISVFILLLAHQSVGQSNPIQNTNGNSVAVTGVEDTWSWDAGTFISGGVTWSVTGGTVGTTTAPVKGTSQTTYTADITFTSGGTQTITIKNSSGTTIKTSSATVTNALLNGGTIGSDQSLCEGETPAAFTSTADATGGDGGYMYWWQHKNNKTNNEWEDITVGDYDETTYQHWGVGGDTEIRRKVTSGSDEEFSNTVYLTILDLDEGSISGAQTICYNGNPNALSNSTGASGGEGGISYKWQISSDDVTFTDISGSGTTSATYDPPALTGSRWYRRKATSCGNTVTKYTTSVKITVRGNPASYTVSSTKDDLCSGETTTISLSNKQSSVEYRLIKGSSQVGSTIAGSATSISWSEQGTGTYKIQGRSHSSCSWVDVSGSKEIGTKSPGSLSISLTEGERIGCSGNSVTLNPSGGSDFSWSWEDITDDTNGSLEVQYQENATVTYTLHGKESVCNTTTTATESIQGLNEVAPFNITEGDESICQGTISTTYTREDSDGATSYTWSLSDGSAGSIDSIGVVTWDEDFSGPVTVNVTASGACNSSIVASREVTVLAPPALQSLSTGSSSTSICEGSYTSVTLGDSQSDYEYRLIKDGNVVSNSTKDGSGSLSWGSLNVGTYEIQGRIGSCDWVTASSDNVVITRMNPGVLSINSTGNLQGCPGQTISLSGIGGTNYSWSYEDTNGDTTMPLAVDIYEGGDITYTLTGNESACGTLVNESVVVGGYLPVKGVTVDSEITSRCQGEGTTDFTHSVAQDALTYEWSLAPNNAGSIDENGQVTWLEDFAGEATITITAFGECETSREDTWMVDVIAPANSFGNTLTAGTQNLCSDDRTTITLNNAQEDYKYRLMKNTSENVGTKTTGYTWSNLDIGDYKIQGRPVGNECSWVDVTNEIEIRRLDPGSVRMAETGPLTGCDEDWVSITPTGGSNYTLREDGDDHDIEPETDGTFRVQVRAGVEIDYILSGTENICGTTDTQRIVVVSDEPYGSVVFEDENSTVCQGDQDVVYTINLVPRATITWSLEPAESGTVVDGVVDWASSFHGIANVRAQATGPCDFSTSETFEVTVVPNVQISLDSPLEERNMGSGTTDYDATSIGAESFFWSLAPAGAGTINTSTGVVNWSPAYNGPATVTVDASGSCGSAQTASAETMIINPNNLALITPETNDVFLTGDDISIEWPEPTSGWLYNIYYENDGVMVSIATEIAGQAEGSNLVYEWADVPDLGFVDILVVESRGLITFQAQNVELISYVSVQTPLAQSYGKGTETNITWTGGSIQSDFLVELYEGGTYRSEIGPNSGRSIPWIIPSNLSNSSEYQIRISQGTQEAFSETFTVVGCVELVTLNEEKNYIRSMVPRVPISECLHGRSKDEVVQSVAYVDGLGRPIQQISIAASPNGLDWVQGTEFDDYGRALRQYLPYASDFSETTIGSYRSSWKNEQISYLDERFNGSIDKDFGYSEQIPENSPLNRHLKAAAPGQVWSTDDGTHLVENTYLINDGSETVPDVYVNDLGGMVFGEGTYYAAEELTGIRVTDENNGDQEGESIAWTNKSGQTVLKAVKIVEDGTVTYMKTFYGYDNYGNLRFVVQPQGVRLIEEGVYTWADLSDTGFREKWMFTYEYDQRQRMISKSVPGAEPVELIYDFRDRLVMTRDGNQNQEEYTRSDVILNGDTDPIEPFYEVHGASIKLQEGFHLTATSGSVFLGRAHEALGNSGWVFTKYDHLNRPIMTGQADLSGTSGEIIDALDTHHLADGAFGESYTGSGPLFGYTNDAFPYEGESGTSITEDDLFTVTFYDNYDFTDEVHPSGEEAEAIGQVTGSKTRVLGTDTWLTSIIFYDERYRVIKTITENYLGGHDIVELDYLNAISGLVTRTTTTHTGGEPVNIVEENEYDHMDRLLSMTQSINGGDTEVIARNTYNKMGELIEKNVGGSLFEGGQGDVSPIQSIDFDYNIRGWLTSINKGQASNSGESDQFRMVLNYHDAAGFEQFNGNIGRIKWQTEGGNGQQTTSPQQFNYTYDAVSRIQSADYVGGDHDLSSVEYDFNGNILNLSRNALDDLTYSYGTGTAMSNQLLSVADAGDTLLFYDRNTSGNDYAYDDNGNMTRDLNKEISSITYNHLNLPEVVNTKDGDGSPVVITYTYDATGIKLRKSVQSGNNTITTDYNGGLHFINNSLSFVQHGAGRALNNNGVFQYEYNLTDHLGNVRASVAMGEDGLEVLQRDDYYPFGLTFNSWHVSPENKYKFQGQEHQDETGWDSFKWRNHDPALGRFFNVDPLAEKFYYNSPYAFSENKVTAHIELEGLEAWDIKNEWDEETIKKYEEFAAQKAAEYESNEVRCTCEDLALNIMIDFASENQLPLQITNNSGENGASVTLDAASEDYSDVDGFRNEVLSTTGANDLSNGTNTVDVSKNDLKKGDMLLFVNSEGRGHHTQVVTFTTPGVVNINQGNFDQGGLRQSSDPNFLGGAGYIGAKVQRGTYDRSNGGKYYNHSTGGQRDGLLNASGVRGKRWNFFKWNKK